MTWMMDETVKYQIITFYLVYIIYNIKSTQVPSAVVLLRERPRTAGV